MPDCEQPNCLTQGNRRRRRANAQCGRTPKRCAPCCRADGGCSEHPVKASPVPALDLHSSDRQLASQPTTTSSSSTGVPPSMPTHEVSRILPAARSYARPMSEEYARGWVKAHQRTQQAEEILKNDQQVASEVAKTITVVFWAKVCRSSSLRDSHVNYCHRVVLLRIV